MLQTTKTRNPLTCVFALNFLMSRALNSPLLLSLFRLVPPGPCRCCCPCCCSTTSCPFIIKAGVPAAATLLLLLPSVVPVPAAALLPATPSAGLLLSAVPAAVAPASSASSCFAPFLTAADTAQCGAAGRCCTAVLRLAVCLSTTDNSCLAVLGGWPTNSNRAASGRMNCGPSSSVCVCKAGAVGRMGLRNRVRPPTAQHLAGKKEAQNL